MEPGLEAVSYYDPPNMTYPFGAYICVMDIDVDTGVYKVRRFYALDDCGTRINPMIIEGQVHGGIAQGFGQAVCEEMRFDADGQLLSGSFMDYALPRAADLPFFRVLHEPTPTANNPLGMKGCGEAGTVGALSALSNAVLDALWDRGVRHVDMPFTPLRIWQWLQDAESSARPG